MSPYEEQLQKQFEEGKPPQGDSLDVRAYGEVFRALETEPRYRLPPGFAKRVVSRLEARQKRRDTRDYIWFAAGLLFLAISFIATILYTGFRLDWSFLSPMSDYKGLLIFGVLFIIFLNWIDRRVVRPRSEGF